MDPNSAASHTRLARLGCAYPLALHDPIRGIVDVRLTSVTQGPFSYNWILQFPSSSLSPSPDRHGHLWHLKDSEIRPWIRGTTVDKHLRRFWRAEEELEELEAARNGFLESTVDSGYCAADYDLDGLLHKVARYTGTHPIIFHICMLKTYRDPCFSSQVRTFWEPVTNDLIDTSNLLRNTS